MKQQKQSGFAHVMIITVIVSVALIGALGFIFWQNFMQPKTNTAKTDSSKISSSTSTKTAGASSTKATPAITPDPTANWKTYNGTILSGFSVKYPDGWLARANNIGVNSPSGIPLESFTVSMIDPKGDGDYWVEISRNTSSDDSTSSLKAMGATNIYTTNIGGFDAIAGYIPSTSQSPASTNYLFSRDNKKYSISILHMGSGNYNSVGFQILNTFKFN